MPFCSQLLGPMMRRVILACLAVLGCGAALPASAQDPMMPDMFGDDAFEVPLAPEIQIPGGPAPDPLCRMEAEIDFNASPYNPGILTAAQYRRWSISGYDRTNPEHVFFLGLMYEYGHHLNLDQRRAKQLYEEAADLGFLPAVTRLAKIACSKRLYCTSARGFFKAANRGSKPARLALSKHYRWGNGVFYDPIAAYMWAWVGMEKTKGNWLVVDPDGEYYLRSLETYMTDTDLELAETKINDWKNGFDNSPLRCKQD